MKRITFNKGAVILCFLAIIGLPVICALHGSWPPDSLIYCWFGFWSVEALINARMRTTKKRTEKDRTFWEAVAPYINQDNAEAIVRHYTGITPRREK